MEGYSTFGKNMFWFPKSAEKCVNLYGFDYFECQLIKQYRFTHFTMRT